MNKTKLIKSLDRLESILKVFCPTGEGGGVDPSCSSGGGSVSIGVTPMPESTKKSMRKWFMDQSDEETEAAQAFTGDHYVEIRRSIAEGRPTQRAVDFLKVLDKAPAFEGEVYRGVRNRGEGSYTDELMKSIKLAGEGGSWTDSAPHSMSRNGAKAIQYSSGDLLFKIKTKTGRAIEDASEYDDEMEVCGLPGTKYRIAKIQEMVKTSSGDLIGMVVDLEEM